MNYGKAIRTARSIADRSQEDVAKDASINRSYLSSLNQADDCHPLAHLKV